MTDPPEMTAVSGCRAGTTDE